MQQVNVAVRLGQPAISELLHPKKPPKRRKDRYLGTNETNTFIGVRSTKVHFQRFMMQKQKQKNDQRYRIGRRRRRKITEGTNEVHCELCVLDCSRLLRCRRCNHRHPFTTQPDEIDVEEGEGSKAAMMDPSPRINQIGGQGVLTEIQLSRRKAATRPYCALSDDDVDDDGLLG